MHKPVKPLKHSVKPVEHPVKEEPKTVTATHVFRIPREEKTESRPITRKRVIKREELLKPKFHAILRKWFNHLRKFKKITQLAARIKIPEPLTELEEIYGNTFDRTLKELARLLKRELIPEEKIALYMSAIIRKSVNVARSKSGTEFLEGFEDLKDFFFSSNYFNLFDSKHSLGKEFMEELNQFRQAPETMLEAVTEMLQETDKEKELQELAKQLPGIKRMHLPEFKK